MTKAPAMTDLLAGSLRRAGVPVRRLWCDLQHRQAHEPAETRTQPGTGIGSRDWYEQSFYPTILRWTLDDGRNGSVMLSPILRREGLRWREDHMAQAQQFFERITTFYQTPLTTPNDASASEPTPPHQPR